MSSCIECGHSVANGGNRHKTGTCPPKKARGINRRARKREVRAEEAKQRQEQQRPPRGRPVAGTGKNGSGDTV